MKMKRVFRRVLLTVLSLVILFGQLGLEAVFASEADKNDISLAKTRAELFLQNLGKEVNIDEGIILENIYGDNEAVAYSMLNGGYMIVNIKDLSIPELSFESNNPYIGVINPVYNGPMNYYSRCGDKLIAIMTNEECDLSQLSIVYCADEIRDKEAYIRMLQGALQKRRLRAITQRNLSISLKKWYTGGNNCGPIACAICMRFYYDCVDSAYLRSGYTNEGEAIQLMISYLRQNGTTPYQVMNGMNRYFADMNISNTAVALYYFDFDILKSKINQNRPVIVGTEGHNEYGDHWIIAHGYFINREADIVEKYIIVNNGWRENNVWLNLDTNRRYFDSMVYFTK